MKARTSVSPIRHALRGKSLNRLSPRRLRIHHAVRDESSDAFWLLQPSFLSAIDRTSGGGAP